MIDLSEKLVCKTVITNIDENIEIGSSYGFLDNALAFSRSETGCSSLKEVSVTLISGKSQRICMLVLTLLAPFNQILVNLFSEMSASFQGDDPERTYGDCVQISDFVFNG